ncbi:MAG: hypothetical protein JJ975_04680 [Bacteroidia bacterium]|nr:hypothetical protein [Bacteroidia bacterium]
MRFLITCFLCLPGFYSVGQSQLIESQHIDSNHTYSLTLDSGSYYLQLWNEQGPVATKGNIDSLVASTDRSLRAIHLNFLSPSTGFVYGYQSGYGHTPFIFKTNDSGKHWKRVLFEKSEWAAPLRKDDFFMFNDKQGIVMCNLHNVKSLVYYLTNDGGITWEKQKFRMRETTLKIKNDDAYLSTICSSNGKVTCVVKEPDLNYGRNTRVYILRSDDFGSTFRIIE